MEIVKAKLDVVFKTLFTKNTDLLKCFVADILDIPKSDITNLTVENPNVMPTAIDGKQSQLDLKLSVDDKIVNVEIQFCNRGGFEDRSLYYWSKMYSDELKKAEDYSLLKRTICINIVDFELFKESKNPYSKFLILEEKRHDLLTDKFAIMFLELGKIDSKIEKNDRKKLWMQFLKAETEEELDMLKETDVPEIQKAIGFLHEMSSDNEIRELARLREKAIYDEKSAMSFARREGIKEGMKKGEAKGRKDGIKEGEAKILTKLRDKGFTEEQIRNLLN